VFIRHWAAGSTGIRTFVNLMKEDETNWAGEPFVPYQDLAVKLCPEVTCLHYPIQDLSAPPGAPDGIHP
jgi:hypothetical protein